MPQTGSVAIALSRINLPGGFDMRHRESATGFLCSELDLVAGFYLFEQRRLLA
jgi:hypothetical protein